MALKHLRLASIGVGALIIIALQVITAAPARAAGCFDDGRINANCAAPIAVYCTDGGGFEIWRIDEEGKGQFATDVSAEDVQAVTELPDEFWQYGYPWTLGLYFHISVTVNDQGSSESYLIITSNYLPDKQFQINVQSSDTGGKDYIIRFDKCDGSITYEKFVTPEEQ